MTFLGSPTLPLEVLDILPNPVLVKDQETRYVWVNRAFERLFEVRRDDLIGRLDVDVFVERQAAQCNGGDLRVLESGEVDEAYETVFDPELGVRETITRKSRLRSDDGSHYLVGVMHDITEVTQTNERLTETTELLERQAVELTRQAKSDSLTGCLNRRALFEIAPVAFAAAGGSGGLALLDIDRFKNINDTYGHAAGDQVLIRMAELANTIIRPTDSMARLGGEEFAVLLPGATEEQTHTIAQRICDATALEPFRFGDTDVNVTISIGGAYKSDSSPLDLERMLATADARLYEAKSTGRNRVVLS